MKRNGYYGGIRLLKATINRFFRYCQDHGVPLDARNFKTAPELTSLQVANVEC